MFVEPQYIQTGFVVLGLGFPESSAGKESICSARDSWVRRLPWRRDRLRTPVFFGFPHGSDSKESACSARNLGLIPGLERSPGGGHGNPLHCFCLENCHGQRSLAGYSAWGNKESDTTEWLSLSHFSLSSLITGQMIRLPKVFMPLPRLFCCSHDSYQRIS